MFYTESDKIDAPEVVREKISREENQLLNDSLRKARYVVADLVKGVLDDDFQRDHNLCCKVTQKATVGGIVVTINVTSDKLDEYGELSSQSHEAVCFSRDCLRYNIPANWYGREFKIGAHRYRVVAINQKAHTYPIICDSWNGSGRYSKRKMSVQTLKDYLLAG